MRKDQIQMYERIVELGIEAAEMRAENRILKDVNEKLMEPLRLHNGNAVLLSKVKEIAFGDGSAQERMVEIKELFTNKSKYE